MTSTDIQGSLFATPTPCTIQKATENEIRRDETLAAEFFETPAETVDCLLEGGGPPLPGGVWADPCAGHGRIPRAVNRLRRDVSWRLGELRASCKPYLAQLDPQVAIGDFLARKDVQVDVLVAIFNSPFTLTVRFVEQSWLVFPNAIVVSLQRQSFCGPGRRRWLLEHHPNRYELPYRPSYRADGKTDGCEYEWHVWPVDGRNQRSYTGCMLERPGQEEMVFE